MKNQMVKVALIMLLASAVIMTPVGVYAENVESTEITEDEVKYVSSDGNEIIANDESGIPDVHFYNLILNQADSNEDGVLTRLEANQVNVLYIQGDIQSIKGIEFFSNLTSLDLLYTDNNISDISALGSLTNLTSLELGANNISDISALGSLANLTSLGLGGNNISDISALGSLTNLTTLNLHSNNISDISALGSLTNLTNLYLNVNNISNISALSCLTNLTSLYLNGNNISDISALSSLTNLTVLYLSGNNISDISALRSLTNLTQLNLDGNNISDISALSSLTNLTVLDLHDNNISGISALGSLTNLTNLYLSGNNISDISALGSLTNLINLYLHSNNISDISALSSLTNLTNLYLSGNNISDISAISVLNSLEIILDLSDNNISDISALSSLTNLISLNLSDNNISNISALGSLTNLVFLDLDDNNISDISVLSDLTKLRSVSYSGNPISTDPVSVRNFVSRLYALVLGREAEESELDSWAQVLLEKKSSGVDAGYGFVFSDECKNRNLSNEDFVEILYKTFMDRPSDEGGKSAWVSQLEAGVEREKVFEGFVYSTEFAEICAEYGINVGNIGDVDALAEKLGHYRNRNADITKFVARCYTEALGRVYEPAGLEDWCRVIINQENTPKQVAQNFIFSDEFVGKHLSDEEYVKVLYRTFMGREADEGGLTAWVAVLESGKEDRAKVLEGFSDSVEFAGILQSFGLN